MIPVQRLLQVTRSRVAWSSRHNAMMIRDRSSIGWLPRIGRLQKRAYSQSKVMANKEKSGNSLEATSESSGIVWSNPGPNAMKHIPPELIPVLPPPPKAPFPLTAAQERWRTIRSILPGIGVALIMLWLYFFSAEEESRFRQFLQSQNPELVQTLVDMGFMKELDSHIKHLDRPLLLQRVYKAMQEDKTGALAAVVLDLIREFGGDEDPMYLRAEAIGLTKMSEEEFVKQGCRVWNDFSNLEMYSAVKEATGVYGVPPDVYSKMKDVFALERTLHGNKYTPARLKTMCEVLGTPCSISDASEFLLRTTAAKTLLLEEKDAKTTKPVSLSIHQGNVPLEVTEEELVNFLSARLSSIDVETARKKLQVYMMLRKVG